MHNAMKMARGRVLEGDMVIWWWRLVERLKRVALSKNAATQRGFWS